MAVPLDEGFLMTGMGPHLTKTQNWAVDISKVRTVRVGNISISASERDIREFFSFSGDIEYVEMQSETEWSKVAYITFKEPQGAETAMLLSGATIVDLSVSVTPVENYKLPPEAYKKISREEISPTESAVRKAEDMVSSMLAKGFVLSKDALNKARLLDEQHQLLSSASATVASLDSRIRLSEKISMGTSIVSSKAREVDERFQVSEIARSALSAAEQTASIAGSAIMGNRYVSTGASWFSSAISMVAKAANDVSSMTKEKVEKAEEERKEISWKERNGIVSEYAQIHLDDTPLGEPATLAVESVDEQKLRII